MECAAATWHSRRLARDGAPRKEEGCLPSRREEPRLDTSLRNDEPRSMKSRTRRRHGALAFIEWVGWARVASGVPPSRRVTTSHGAATRVTLASSSRLGDLPRRSCITPLGTRRPARRSAPMLPSGVPRAAAGRLPSGRRRRARHGLGALRHGVHGALHGAARRGRWSVARSLSRDLSRSDLPPV